MKRYYQRVLRHVQKLNARATVPNLQESILAELLAKVRFRHEVTLRFQRWRARYKARLPRLKKALKWLVRKGYVQSGFEAHRDFPRLRNYHVMVKGKAYLDGLVKAT